MGAILTPSQYEGNCGFGAAGTDGQEEGKRVRRPWLATSKYIFTVRTHRMHLRQHHPHLPFKHLCLVDVLLVLVLVHGHARPEAEADAVGGTDDTVIAVQLLNVAT